ncbi:MAG: hypothetical protein D6705_09330 [Deltaproteobacteria bacterium]|nr:MAG: hypothetical protein D6705_09330 [Deltaproteobacteria bacterium]
MLALMAVGGAMGCAEFGDPPAACDAPWVAVGGGASDRGVVLAASLPEGVVAVVADCAAQTCTFDERPLHGPDGERLPAGTPVLVSGDARHAVALDDEGRLLHWNLDEDAAFGADESPLALEVTALVAPLRSGATFLVRDAEGASWAYRAGSRVLAPLAGPALHVVTVGDRHVLLERIVDGERRDLFVVDTSAPLPAPEPLASDVRVPTSVEFAPGDAALAVTVPGDAAETFVFVSDGDGAFDLADRFVGTLTTSRGGMSISGLASFSADAASLLYEGPEGGLALRELAGAASCTLWPAIEDRVGAAGITPTGRIYFERVTSDGRDLAVFSPSGGIEGLTHGASLRLFAVPEGDDAPPWAVGVADGAFFGAGASSTPQYLPHRRVSFLPAAGRLFAVIARDNDAPTAELGDRELLVVQLDRPQAEPGTPDPTWASPRPVIARRPDGTERAFLRALARSERVCVAGRFPEPWARRCGEVGSDGFLVGTLGLEDEGP